MVDRAHALPAIRRGAGELLIGVRVSPSAPRTALQGVYGDRLKVSVGAPPEGGRANRELAEALAAWLGLHRNDVRVETGLHSRDKVVAITSVGEAELHSRLAGLLRGRSQKTGE